MVIVIFILLTAASAAYFTSIGCRRALAQHRRPGWHLALLGICITTLLTALFVEQGDLFRPDRWVLGMVIILPAAAVVALISSAIVVSVFRGRFRDENHVA